MTSSMEILLKNGSKFQWTDECQESLDKLKRNMVVPPMLVFPDWKKEFHVHVDASSVALGVVLTQPVEGDIDHPIYFSSRKISTVEKNYTTIEREALAMVYALQKFRNSMAGGTFQNVHWQLCTEIFGQ